MHSTMPRPTPTGVGQPEPEPPPRIYGGLGTLSLLEDGTALYCSDVGDVAEVSADLVRDLGLTDGARLHARLLVQQADLFGCRAASLCKILAWHALHAVVDSMDERGILLRTDEGPRLRLPAFHAVDHDLVPGSRIEVVAAPVGDAPERWSVVTVRRWAA